ncbi:ATP-binding cassette domain-containing protein [Blautia sp. AM46-5]|nr:ATP-binding cassette domain-containing protein [Blautia sp. AM46-5]
MIEVSHLVKEFKIPVQKKGRLAAVRNLFSGEHTIKRAVDDITFSVDDGEIVGFIGKNGAGKSTTIKMLSGILQPTSGNVTVDGIKPFEQRMENAKQIGVVFGQKTQLWWDVPLIESYRLLREIYKNWGYNALLRFFSGQMVPLWIFPSVLGVISDFLPFRCIYAIPMSIYIGNYVGVDMLGALVVQFIWIFILWLTSCLLMKRVFARVMIQGG